MFESLARHPMRLLVGVVAFLVILSQTLAIVPEDKQALILRFGEIERTVNRYKPNEDFGRSGAGLVLRVPFTDGIQYIDKRILGVNMERQQVLSWYLEHVASFATLQLQEYQPSETSFYADYFAGQVWAVMSELCRTAEERAQVWP